MSATVPAFQSIRIAERGSTDISASEWSDLARSPAFWGLVERGVVSVEQVQHGKAKLLGGCYVGRSRVGSNFVLEVHEKVPGSLAALLSFASGSDFRVEHLQSPSTDLGNLISLLAAHFVEATRQYATRGRQFCYVTKRMRGSLVGGRLDVTRTLQLHARGLWHLAAFDKNTISFDTPINRIVLAALREVERMQALVDLPREVVVRARGMAMVFDDCRGPEVLYGIKSEMADQAEKLANAANDRATSDLMALAAVILSNESFEQAAPQRGVAPRAWFLNLETLFEKAVRETIRRAMNGLALVVPGRVAPAPIFSGYQGLRAHPDVVIRATGEPLTSVGDVKYKQWSGAPNAADMYQLLVHAAAFKARQTFLVYPSESFQAIKFGTAATGASSTAYTLDIKAMPEQVRFMLSDLALVPAASLAASSAGG